MIYFDTDYMAGAHPKVMERLLQTNSEQTVGYGSDGYTLRAKELVKQACSAPYARVYFLVGGTQTNSTVIDGVLEHHEGVLAAESGHINVHESGAIEATGHKVLTLPSYDGKVKAEDVRNFIANFYSDDTYEHMVAPGMLYISFPTEYGTIYSLNELEYPVFLQQSSIFLHQRNGEARMQARFFSHDGSSHASHLLTDLTQVQEGQHVF